MSTSTRLLPHRVLLVDDDADERDAIASFLELEGAEVAVAGDGEEALSALQADPSRCLILLDLQMPGMNEACRAGAVTRGSGCALRRSLTGARLLALHVPALKLVGVELAHVGAVSVEYQAPVVGLVTELQAAHTESLPAPAGHRLQDYHRG